MKNHETTLVFEVTLVDAATVRVDGKEETVLTVSYTAKHIRRVLREPCWFARRFLGASCKPEVVDLHHHSGVQFYLGEKSRNTHPYDVTPVHRLEHPGLDVPKDLQREIVIRWAEQNAQQAAAEQAEQRRERAKLIREAVAKKAGAA